MRAATTRIRGLRTQKGRRSFSLDIVVGNEIVDEGVVGGGSLRRDLHKVHLRLMEQESQDDRFVAIMSRGLAMVV